MNKRMVCLWMSIFCMVLSGLFGVNHVSAAIPLITDDTGTQGKGKFQLELGGEYGHDKAKSVTNKDSACFAANPEHSATNPPAYVLGGLIYSLGENLDIGLGVKGGLTKPEADIAVRGGITWRF